MPLPPGSLLALVAIGVELLSLLRADDADLVILNAVFATRVDDWVDVETGSLGFAGKLSKTLNEFLLQVVV